MTGDNMKSGVVDSDRLKLDGRQPVHRRKMSKNPDLLNGTSTGVSVAYEDESMVIRQVNLAADLCKISSDTKETRTILPCETDHTYANCRDKPRSHGPYTPANLSKKRNDEKKKLQDMCSLYLKRIHDLEEQNASKEKEIHLLKQENESLKVRQERMERRFLMLRNRTRSDYESDNVSDGGSVMSDSSVSPTATRSDSESDNVSDGGSVMSDSPVSPTATRSDSESDNVSDGGSVMSDSPVSPTASSTLSEHPQQPMTHAAMHLVTRYVGRRSKTVPSRTLKRRYFGPPKTIPCKKTATAQPSIISACEIQDEKSPGRIPAESPVTISVAISELKPLEKQHKRGHRQKVIPKDDDFLTTDKEPMYYKLELPFMYFAKHINVPSWRNNPIPSFYQMEGTENINDQVFERQHLKCEQEERRRKRWDIQRLREQRVSDKLRYKQASGDKLDGDDLLKRRPNSFYPNPNKIEYIEVAEKMPVLAFGRPICLIQPSEFSLPWKASKFSCSDKSRKSTPNGAQVT